jgi:hypothetical protein
VGGTKVVVEFAMLAFEIMERIETAVGAVSFRIEKKAGHEVIEVGVTLTDEQLDQVLASVADQIGSIEHSPFKTSIELLA